ncbi:ATP-binding protein [Myxococcota bacterium]|nr:ATP-binding protein [Myxococcota bacterium]
MKRFIDSQLDEWAASDRRKPLIVRGARQVGKTWSIRELGRRRFDEVVVVDLELHRDWHSIFDRDLDARRIVSELDVVSRSRITPGQTLLFFDEIQACPRAISALRYFYEQMPDLHVVAAGSMLEFALGEYPVPVGRVRYLEMYPMTFVETLWSGGQVAAAQAAVGNPADIGPVIHEHLLKEVWRYCFVGGMPEAVAAYQESGRLVDAFAVHAELVASFRDDFAKYAPRVNPNAIGQVLTSVAESVGGQIKYSRLAPDFSGPTAKSALELLVRARIVRTVAAADPSGLPLTVGAGGSRFKAVLVDIGLWQSLRGVIAGTDFVRGDLLAVHRGAMAEQFIGQELAAAQRGNLYYWCRDKRGSSAEVDYLAVRDGSVFAIEVKSGESGSLRSLHMLLDSYKNVAGGLVFQSGSYATLPERRLTFTPLYSAWAAVGGVLPTP